jgi:hypothetical protein
VITSVTKLSRLRITFSRPALSQRGRRRRLYRLGYQIKRMCGRHALAKRPNLFNLALLPSKVGANVRYRTLALPPLQKGVFGSFR